MSSKHSRSELEAALTPKSKAQNASNHNKANTQDRHLEHGRRRQQVIGGNLTGVANRRNAGLLAKVTDINLFNWIAVILVLLILLAFFWPSTEHSAIREKQHKIADSENDLIHNQNKQDSTAIGAPTVQTFSRATDLQRADGYREQEALEREISGLLIIASEQIGRGDYTVPIEKNATSTYRKILAISPNNAKAEQGLEYIRRRILASGIKALEKNDQQTADQALNKIIKIESEAVEALQLREAIADWSLTNQVNQLLSQANSALQAERLILPPRKNALYYFQQVLELGDNKSATDGIKAIADNFIEQASAAISIGRLESATSFLATVSVIEPEHPSLSLLEETIKKATPIARELNARSLAAQQTNDGSTQPPSKVIPTRATQATNETISASKASPLGLQKQSAEQELLDRQYLARGLEAYYKGEYDKAASFLQPLADKGISRAQFRIGYMYYQGRGFKTNRNEADRIIRAALPSIQKFADETRSWAQSDIGSLYEDGLVLPRDYGEAVFWYRLAAEQGYPGAQTNLGIMYALGRGVPASRRTAIDWFQQAAKQGDVLAKRNLESLGVTE